MGKITIHHKIGKISFAEAIQNDYISIDSKGMKEK